MYKRVIIKLSGEALGGTEGKGFDDSVVTKIVKDIVKVVKQGVEVSIVIGGGNFWRGRSADSKMDRSKADQVGMLATIMNGIYVSDCFKQQGINAVVMTPFVVGAFTKQFDKDESLKILKNGGVCIFSGGVGHPYFSTDTITALRGAELSVSAILYAKNIDGIYDKDPNLFSGDATKFKEISYDEIIKKDLKAIDISAMNLSKEQKQISLVFALQEPNSILTAVAENEDIFKIGTKVIF